MDRKLLVGVIAMLPCLSGIGPCQGAPMAPPRAPACSVTTGTIRFAIVEQTTSPQNPIERVEWGAGLLCCGGSTDTSGNGFSGDVSRSGAEGRSYDVTPYSGTSGALTVDESHFAVTFTGPTQGDWCVSAILHFSDGTELATGRFTVPVDPSIGEDTQEIDFGVVQGSAGVTIIPPSNLPDCTTC